MNQFEFEVVKVGDVEFFISKSIGIPPITVPVPYLRPDRSYGHINASDFNDNLIRVIMYKTPNNYINELFDNNTYHNFDTEPSEMPIWLNFQYKNVETEALMKPHSIYVRNASSDLGVEFSYTDSREKIERELDSLLG